MFNSLKKEKKIFIKSSYNMNEFINVEMINFITQITPILLITN